MSSWSESSFQTMGTVKLKVKQAAVPLPVTWSAADMSFHLLLASRRQRCCAQFGAVHWTNGQQAVKFNKSCVVLASPQPGHSSGALHWSQRSSFHGTFSSQMGAAFIFNHIGHQIKSTREHCLQQARMLWGHTFHFLGMPATKSSWRFLWTCISRCKDDKDLTLIQVIQDEFRGPSRMSEVIIWPDWQTSLLRLDHRKGS